MPVRTVRTAPESMTIEKLPLVAIFADRAGFSFLAGAAADLVFAMRVTMFLRSEKMLLSVQ